MIDIAQQNRFFGEVVRQARRKDVVVVPLEQSHVREIYVNPKDRSVKIGDIVEGTLLSDVGARSRGRIDRVFRAENVVDLAIEVALALQDVPQTWPKGVNTQNVPAQVDEKSLSQRVDLRGLPFVTVDGADARDFDDAVYCESNADGWRLTVAIADVAHYVEVGGDLDVEASKRGTSVYLPGKVVPMLPQALSTGICSLNPNQDRLVLVCDMQVSASGEVVASSFDEAVIRSHARLTYREVAEFLRTGESLLGGSAIRDSIVAFHDVYNALSKAARARGSVDFNTVETFIEIEHGKPQRVRPIERNNAHRMIELAMVAANVQAAEFLERHKVILLYRAHEPPDVWSMRQVLNRLASRGVAVPDQIEKPKQLQRLLYDLRKVCKPAHIWEVMLLSTMEAAHYAPHKLGHFGLALNSYAHFTSPIRRYPDLVVHRLIKRALGHTELPELTFNQLAEVGVHTSSSERRAISVERRVDGWLKASLLKSKVGELFGGVVAGVREFGLFVELDGYFTSGLLHVSNLPDDYYSFFGGELRGETNGRVFRIGDRVRTRLIDVQAPSAKLSLALA
ncbi:MAG: VacB/RNase II family 3'-5' exoribonuclease [Gammaproteobacteria bacterium]|nr:VacB/RNase II family 3'-5' exoribonuclease [Gammaproteobacteria bacterium]